MCQCRRFPRTMVGRAAGRTAAEQSAGATRRKPVPERYFSCVVGLISSRFDGHAVRRSRRNFGFGFADGVPGFQFWFPRQAESRGGLAALLARDGTASARSQRGVLIGGTNVTDDFEDLVAFALRTDIGDHGIFRVEPGLATRTKVAARIRRQGAI